MGSAKLSAQAISRFGFYVGNRRVETVSALQMLNLENIAHNEIGLTESIMTENAGRGIAEVVLLALADPAIRVRHPPAAVSGAAGSSGADTASPVSMAAANATVVVMAGNNKSGIRAVAAARHLRARGIGQVLLCVVGIERERDLLEDLRLQLRVYANLGGRVHSKIDLFEHLRKMDGGRGGRASGMASSSAIAGAGDASMGSGGGVTLIVDALLGLAVSFEELRTGDQATVYELMEWANRNEAFVLAVDVPTGIDPSSGKVAIIDGDRLYVRPRYVVALGAPKKGLAEALATAAMAAAARRAAARSSNPGSASSSEDAADDTEEGPRSGENLVGAGTSAVEAAAAAASMGIVPPVSGEEVVDAEDWKLYVADMGIGAAAWKKAGTKLRRGIEFGDRWVLEMQYRGPQERDIE